MIHLQKLPEPLSLIDHGAEWTQILLGRLAANEEPTKAEKTRYNQPDIKAVLVNETRGKCAYCESKLRHISPGDIEHIIPKSIEPAEAFEWQNLTLACEECNRRKGNKIGPFIDPYAVDPADHLEFHGAMIWSKGASESGTYSERTFELNRAELLERRNERQRNLLIQIDLIQKETNPQVREALREDFLHELEADKEYAALARALHSTHTAFQ